MSNVLARFRGETDCQCLVDARCIRAELLGWAFKEINIPKKYRPSFIPYLKEYTNAIVNNTRYAQRAYPTNEELLKERKKYIKLAEEQVVNLWQELQCLDDTRKFDGGIDLDKLEPILTKIYNLQISLQKWRNNNKLQKT